MSVNSFSIIINQPKARRPGLLGRIWRWIRRLFT